jgi:type IV pilus assembly protein PilV
MKSTSHPSSIAGFTLLEVLVSMVVIALGLLGLAGLQVRLQQAEFESYQRSQAIVLLYDMVDSIRANKAAASCFAITTNTTAGTPYYGTGSASLPSCVASITSYNTLASTARAQWDDLLKGAAEKSGTTSVGSMIGARGCVSYGGSSSEILSGGVSIAGTGIYTVAVSWQGTGDSSVPTANCANGLYGNESMRRTVSTTFRIATLN